MTEIIMIILAVLATAGVIYVNSKDFERRFDNRKKGCDEEEPPTD